MDAIAETFSDKLLGFTIPARNARGRAVRLDAVLDDVLSAHDYPPPIMHLLSEALVLSALMGGLLKHEGDDAQLTLQAQTESGAVSLLVCDFRGGVMRGYVDFDEAALEGLGANPSLDALFGRGYLTITFETGKGRRHQGIVPLEGETLAEAVEAYFGQSEQVPTIVRIATQSNGAKKLAAGLLVQHLADGEEGRERLHVRLDHPDWEHVSIMAASIKHEELVDQSLSMEAIVWRLFHEEEQVRVQPHLYLRKGCRCSQEYYTSVISRFPAEDQEAMRNEDGIILVDCAFCSTVFKVT